MVLKCEGPCVLEYQEEASEGELDDGGLLDWLIQQ